MLWVQKCATRDIRYCGTVGSFLWAGLAISYIFKYMYNLIKFV